MIFDVALEMIGQLVDTLSEKGNLDVRAAGILVVHPQRLNILRFGHIDQSKGWRVCCDIASRQVLVRGFVCRTTGGAVVRRIWRLARGGGSANAADGLPRGGKSWPEPAPAVASWLLFAREC